MAFTKNSSGLEALKAPSFLQCKQGTWSWTRCIYGITACADSISSHCPLQWASGHLALEGVSPEAFISDSIISSPVLLLHMSCIVSGCFISPLPWRNSQSQAAAWAHTAKTRWLVLFLGLLKGWRIDILFSEEEGVSMSFTCAHLWVYLEYDP